MVSLRKNSEVKIRTKIEVGEKEAERSQYTQGQELEKLILAPALWPNVHLLVLLVKMFIRGDSEGGKHINVCCHRKKVILWRRMIMMWRKRSQRGG